MSAVEDTQIARCLELKEPRSWLIARKSCDGLVSFDKELGVKAAHSGPGCAAFTCFPIFG